ncbi:MAG: hypothetical protein ACI9LY_003459 [Arenicella sp.]|jgi:hypothetical protein
MLHFVCSRMPIAAFKRIVSFSLPSSSYKTAAASERFSVSVDKSFDSESKSELTEQSGRIRMLGEDQFDP